jgi:tRNA wybutosine-synthesizing protein 4
MTYAFHCPIFCLFEVANARTQVVVHEAETEAMNFQTKNFRYVTKRFQTFVDEVYGGSRQYLRSISAEQPAKQPANLAEDFPELKDDFRLPSYLAQAQENVHSSPLRISGRVTMWLHYDVSVMLLFLLSICLISLRRKPVGCCFLKPTS